MNWRWTLFPNFYLFSYIFFIVFKRCNMFYMCILIHIIVICRADILNDYTILRLSDLSISILDPNGAYVSIRQKNKELSVILEFCLSSVEFRLPATYTSLFRGLEYSLSLKKYHKYQQHLFLVTHIFSKLSQNMCLIITHILIY